MQDAEQAIARSDWVAAYRFLEDGLVNERADIKMHALELIRLYPQLIVAAESTFSIESIARTLKLHAEDSGINVEMDRLRMFRVVASNEQYEAALENIAAAVKQKNSVLNSAEEARQGAKYNCNTPRNCEKSFSLTQVFISQHADMKIQIATDTIIETYSPTNEFRIGIRATRMPRSDESAEISIDVFCKNNGTISSRRRCASLEERIYLSYPLFISSSMN